MLSFEAVLIGDLIGVVLISSLCRRSSFWLRVAGVAVAIVLPGLVAIVAPLAVQARATVFWSGLVSGLVLLACSRFVLFHGGSSPGSGDEDGEEPDPGDGRRPTPPAPSRTNPLPATEGSVTLIRDHRPARRASRPRRPIRQRERIRHVFGGYGHGRPGVPAGVPQGLKTSSETGSAHNSRSNRRKSSPSRSTVVDASSEPGPRVNACAASRLERIRADVLALTSVHYASEGWCRTQAPRHSRCSCRRRP